MTDQRNFHERLEQGETAASTSDRRFGAVFAALFALIWVAPLLHRAGPRWWALAVALGFGAASLVAPRILSPLNQLWHRFGLLLHRIMSPILLAAIYFCVITPAGMLLRLAGKDPLRLRFDCAAASYWIRRDPPGPAPDGFPRMY